MTAPPENRVRAAFDFNPKRGVAPLEVEFIDMSEGPVSAWAWDFADGGASIIQSPRHIYTKPGVYYPTMIALNDDDSDFAYSNAPLFVDPPLPQAQTSAGSSGGVLVPLAMIGVGLFAYVAYWLMTTSRDTER